MSEKKSFVMYAAWANLISELPDEQAVQLIKAICAFETDREYSIEDVTVASIFNSMILPILIEDNKKYQAKVDNAIDSTKKRTKNANELKEKANALSARYNSNDALDSGNDALKAVESVEEKKDSVIKKQESVTDATESVDAESRKRTQAYESDSVNVNDNVNDNDKDKEKKRVREKAPKAPHSPDPTLNAVIEKFIQHRKLKKKPMSDYAIELLVKKLEKLKPGDVNGQIAMLEESIEHGWDTVYLHDDNVPNNRSSDKKIAFNEFDQRKYDYDDLEKKLLRG